MAAAVWESGGSGDENALKRTGSDASRHTQGDQGMCMCVRGCVYARARVGGVRVDSQAQGLITLELEHVGVVYTYADMCGLISLGNGVHGSHAQGG